MDLGDEDDEMTLSFPSGLKLEWWQKTWIVTLPAEVSIEKLHLLEQDIHDALMLRRVRVG